jgi:hypothetical protein
MSSLRPVLFLLFTAGMLQTTTALAQSPSDAAAIIQSSRSLLQAQLESDEKACEFSGQWTSFVAAQMREQGTPLAEMLRLTREALQATPD